MQQITLAEASENLAKFNPYPVSFMRLSFLAWEFIPRRLLRMVEDVNYIVKSKL